MSMNNAIFQPIKDFLLHISGNRDDIFYELYEKLEAVPQDAPTALQFLSEEFDSISSDHTLEAGRHFDEGEASQLEKSYASFLIDTINELKSRRLGEQDYYVELWDCLGVALFPSTKAKSVALRLIVQCGPYFCLPEVSEISNERFSELSLALYPTLQKVIFILNYSFDTKTDRSTQLLRLSDKCKTEEEKIVFWAQVVDMLQQPTIALLKDIQALTEQLKELENGPPALQAPGRLSPSTPPR